MSFKRARIFTFFVSPYLFLTACNKSPVRPEAIDESPEAKSKGANLIVSDAKHSILYYLVSHRKEEVSQAAVTYS